MIVNQKNELARLEGIVLRDISSFRKMNQELSPELAEDFRVALMEEVEQIKNNLFLTVCSAHGKHELRRYIRLHQQNIIALSSQLLKYAQPDKITRKPVTPELPLLCHYLYHSLEDILAFVERHFFGYFDQDAWVPASYRAIAAQEIRLDLKSLQKKLSSPDVDEKLVFIIFNTFDDFLDNVTSDEVTYRRVKYLKTLKSELIRVTEKAGTANTDIVKRLLISLNFNAGSFFTYCTNYISGTVETAKGQSPKLEKLAYCLKEINQVHDPYELIFDPRYRPLKEQVANWIAEELHFRERSQQLNLSFPGLDMNLPTEAKVQLDLSVAQAACFVNGMMADGMIRNRNLSGMIRLVTKVISTKRAETLSEESFRLKFYNMEYSTRRAVASRLRSIADYLMKD